MIRGVAPHMRDQAAYLTLGGGAGGRSPGSVFCITSISAAVMSMLLQVLIAVAFAAFCFGCGYLTAFIVTRNRLRDQMIERHIARHNWHTGKWEWGEPPKESRY